MIILLALSFLTGCAPENSTIEPEPEQPEYTIGEPMLSDLKRFSLYRDRFLTERPVPVKPTEPEPEPLRYPLTDEERDLVEQVVMAESGNQSYLGNAMVAFCILNACEKDGIRPDAAVVEYQYTPNRVEPSESVQRAVSAVFDAGEKPVMDKPLWFYAYKRTKSDWHERQRPICIVGDHAFFGEWK